MSADPDVNKLVSLIILFLCVVWFLIGFYIGNMCGNREGRQQRRKIRKLQVDLWATQELLAIREEQIGEFLGEPDEEIDDMTEEEIIEAVKQSAGSIPDLPDAER